MAQEACPALVVFGDGMNGTLPARLFGRNGFRHCMVCLAAGAYWIAFDPRPGGLHIEVLAAAEFDLAGHFRMAGYKVVETRRHPSRRHWPLMAATCVGAVKRILGIAAPWVLTPRQLYDHLTGKEI